MNQYKFVAIPGMQVTCSKGGKNRVRKSRLVLVSFSLVNKLTRGFLNQLVLHWVESNLVYNRTSDNKIGRPRRCLSGVWLQTELEDTRSSYQINKHKIE